MPPGKGSMSLPGHFHLKHFILLYCFVVFFCSSSGNPIIDSRLGLGRNRIGIKMPAIRVELFYSP